MRLCSYDKTLENEALKTIELEYQVIYQNIFAVIYFY